ncbi:hypothetical protein BDK51DRAFT_46845 [Blyttiomyces helicus]|uniref:Reelin domain-containing protein n=1 Tax=Blyttiomyces helicus TaxID=388810 RepID=A0A4P9W3J2_9FUNG|nr:hypothetical protein BDK51DRAFT_46845 [Blyttiomyces helicus]|eukprot:RKO85358.1 hypothetical protein BDK51DRAFT_46845 [Blyttiomyces helicus]
MRSALALAAALALAGSVSTYPTHPGVCTLDLATVASIGPMGPLNPLLGYVLKADATTYTPGGPPVTVTLSGGGGLHNGLLLFAADSGGHWAAFNTTYFATMDAYCASYGSGATLGHINPLVKSDTSFTWTPPATDSGSLAFYGIVVVQKISGWSFQGVSSTALTAAVSASSPSTIQFTTISALPAAIQPSKYYKRLQAFHAVGSQLYSRSSRAPRPPALPCKDPDI